MVSLARCRFHIFHISTMNHFINVRCLAAKGKKCGYTIRHLICAQQKLQDKHRTLRHAMESMNLCQPRNPSCSVCAGLATASACACAFTYHERDEWVHENLRLAPPHRWHRHRREQNYFSVMNMWEKGRGPTNWFPLFAITEPHPANLRHNPSVRIFSIQSFNSTSGKCSSMFSIHSIKAVHYSVVFGWSNTCLELQAMPLFSVFFERTERICANMMTMKFRYRRFVNLNEKLSQRHISSSVSSQLVNAKDMYVSVCD